MAVKAKDFGIIDSTDEFIDSTKIDAYKKANLYIMNCTTTLKIFNLTIFHSPNAKSLILYTE